MGARQHAITRFRYNKQNADIEFDKVWLYCAVYFIEEGKMLAKGWGWQGCWGRSFGEKL